MRRLVLSAPILGAALVALAACSIGGDDADAQGSGPGVAASGTGDARSFAVAGFDSVDLRGADDVDIRVGSGFSVRAEGKSDSLDRLKIERDGSTLKIGRKPQSGLHWSDDDAVKILVTMPRIIGAQIAGSGDVAIDRIDGARFDGAIAGSGGLTVGAVQVDEAKLSIAGSGDVTATGKIGRLTIEIAGSGSVDAPGLNAQTAKISVAGSGDVRASVTGTADIDVAGSGDVDLGAAARCTTRIHGSGEVRCGGK